MDDAWQPELARRYLPNPVSRPAVEMIFCLALALQPLPLAPTQDGRLPAQQPQCTSGCGSLRADPPCGEQALARATFGVGLCLCTWTALLTDVSSTKPGRKRQEAADPIRPSSWARVKAAKRHDATRHELERIIPRFQVYASLLGDILCRVHWDGTQ